MTKIAIASCCKIQGQHSQREQPAWQSIEEARPDLVLLLGDNVYMRQSRRRRWDFDQLDETYRRQFNEPHFRSLIDNVPYMATWDDHDFGPNDSRGATEDGRPHRGRSRRLFHQWHDRAINNNRPNVYCSHVIDDIKVIVLDTRYYRTGLRQRHPTILGRTQERWLREELDHDHKFTVVASGTCLIHGGERDKWSAYRDAYARLDEQLKSVSRLMFVAGDLHVNKFNEHDGYFEVISSGIGRLDNRRPLNNYGLINFRARSVDIELRGRKRRHNIDKRINVSRWSV